MNSERNTRQKAAIVEVLHNSDMPMGPQDILHAAQLVVPTVSQATVYRVVKALQDKGTIVTVQLPGKPPLYELAGKEHHHFFRCRKCGAMTEVSGCSTLLKKLVPKGFQLESHDVFLYGLCDACG